MIVRLGDFLETRAARTKALRTARVIGRRSPFARVEPVDGGIELTLFGRHTFVPAKAGDSLVPIRVSGKAMEALIAALGTFDDPEMEVLLDVTDAGLQIRCGNLRRSLPRQ